MIDPCQTLLSLLSMLLCASLSLSCSYEDFVVFSHLFFLVTLVKFAVFWGN